MFLISDLIVLFFSNTLYALLFYFTVGNINSIKIGKKYILILISIISILGIVGGFVDYFSHPLIKDIFIFSGLSLLSILLFNGSTKSKVILSLMFTLVISMMDVIVESSINSVMDSIVRWDNLEIWIKILIVCVETTILFLISRLMIIYGKGNFSYTKNWDNLLSLLVPIISVIIYAIMFDILLLSGGDTGFARLSVVMSILVFLINILVYIIIYSIKLVSEKNIQISSQAIKDMQDAKYADMYRNRDMKKKKFLHDIKKHFNVIRSLAEESRTEDILLLVDSLMEDVSKVESVEYTLSPVVNSILSEKIQKAESIGVKDFKVKIDRSTDFSFVMDKDLVTILSNALDNAVEASEGIKDPYISIVAKNKYPIRGVFIEIENRYENELIKDGELYKSTKNTDPYIKTRGFGLGNIRDAVNSYDGILMITTEENIFTISIIVCDSFRYS